MGRLPMVPSACSLGEDELGDQPARYRSAGEAAHVLERSRRRVAVRVADAIADPTIELLVAIEGRCCPFFELDWDPNERCLTISASKPEREPALDGIAHALGIVETAT